MKTFFEKKSPNLGSGMRKTLQMLHTEGKPDVDIGGDDGCEGEGDADLKEILVFHLIPLFA